MTGKLLTHIPNRAEGERGREGENSDGKMRTRAACEPRPASQTDVWEIWAMEWWKNEGRGDEREGGRERACQMKGTPWLDNEAEGVNMSAILLGGGCSGGTWAPRRVCCLWEVLFIRTETGLTLKQESESQRWTFRGQQQSVWQKQWFCRSVPLGLVLTLWYCYLGQCVAPTPTGKYPHAATCHSAEDCYILRKTNKQKQRWCSDTKFDM